MRIAGTKRALAKWAVSHNVDFLETANINTVETIEKIAAHKPELIV